MPHAVGEKIPRSISVSYVEVNPSTPVSVGIDTADIGATILGAKDYDDRIVPSSLQWPQAPPMIESIGDVFREPRWFKDMGRMVDAGRHISLAGPPGVGKDTAVQELAAREGKILVTIGGDAGFRRRDLVGSQQISSGR